ncbi:MAG: RNA 2',3'-cyclic phosphodiesterase [Candidatus Brocadiia bacterium]
MSVRLFVAIDISEQSRQNLSQAVETMKKCAPELKWVAPQNMHLTLKFIGSVPDNTIPEATRVLQKTAAKAPQFRMEMHGISAFPEPDRPRVLFACIQEDSAHLQKLAEKVDHNLGSALGIKREKRNFVPHVTIARTRRGKKCPPVEELTELLSDLTFGTTEVEKFDLVKSDLTQQGPVYTTVEHFPLLQT